jgi:hypothetical protein
MLAALALLLGMGIALTITALGSDAAVATTRTLEPIYQALFEIILTVTSTATYVALRIGKQGALGDVAEVFA